MALRAAAKDSVMSDLDTIEALTAHDVFFCFDNADPTQVVPRCHRRYAT